MKNGRLPSGKRIKHLGIRYFYVKDLIDIGFIQVDHCISDAMIADFFIKPLQGKHYQVLRDIILNIDSSVEHTSVLTNMSEEEDCSTKEISVCNT
jgi:hypothetical protein